MALKFLNKKGWHTGSLRNIENVWKAEQKHDAEQKKLEELRKQIHEERERAEFRQLQEQAGLVPQQERLEFLYDSGLAVGKSSASDGFKALETLPSKQDGEPPSSSSAPAAQSNVPGALFEDKPHSANDAWRKLHSDPLLMIRQREQEALSRIKNNPVKMAMIKKSVEGNKQTKHKEKSDKKGRQNKSHHSSSEDRGHSLSTDDEAKRRRTSLRKISNYDKHLDSEDESPEKARRIEKTRIGNSKYREHSPGVRLDLSNVRDDEVERRNGRRRSNYDKYSDSVDESPRKVSQYEKRHHGGSRYREQLPGHRSYPETGKNGGQDAVKGNHDKSEYKKYYTEDRRESQHKRRSVASRLSEEERAARLREMQQDAELHEEQRWKRLKKAAEDDAREAKQVGSSSGRSFLDAAQKSVYGADKGCSATIAESVRRRAYYSQGGSEASSGNAFRR